MDNYLAEHYEREALKLRDEIQKFKDEANIWKITGSVPNSAGTLALHLMGNLNFTIGATIGGTGYVRNREEEFSLRDVSQAKLLADIESTVEVVKTSLAKLTPEKLEEIYPLEFVGQKSTGFYLTYMYGHLTYHIGQINYLRRVLEP